MRVSQIVAAVICVLHLFLSGASGTDLSKIARTIAKEPNYTSQPKYCLLVLGPSAQSRAWLVLDGDTLYVDRRGTGDLTQPDCRVVGEADSHYERFFKAGDITVDGKGYGDLQVAIESAKGVAGSARGDMPMFKEFLASQPDGKLFSISVDVPFDKPFPDVRDKSPLKGTRQYMTGADARGVFQFAARPEQAPIIHFGGPWTVWPDGQQKLVRGRNEELTLLVGTPGHGPGTFACICYDILIPTGAKPHVRIEYAAKAGDQPVIQDYVLEDRC